jgi:hypothetical protein
MTCFIGLLAVAAAALGRITGSEMEEKSRKSPIMIFSFIPSASLKMKEICSLIVLGPRGADNYPGFEWWGINEPVQVSK